jgi:rubrerythrin
MSPARRSVDVQRWSQSLLNHLVDHMDRERGLLRRYEELSASAPDEQVRYIVALILADEVKHHQLFADMVGALRAEMGSPALTSDRLPRHVGDHQHDAELAAATAELLAVEEGDAHDLENLRAALDQVADTRWWTLLVDVMALDTRKHIQLLTYLRDRLG